MSRTLTRYYVADAQEVREAGKVIVTVKNMEIGLFFVDGAFYAWRNVCPHAGAPVCMGTVTGTHLPTPVYEYQYGLERQILRCPWHGWEFNLKDGKHLTDSKIKLKGVEVVEEDGKLYVLLS